jgi:coenzyme Q-binding protein COQ10
MPQVKQSIHIQAPVELVFDIIANQPERQPDWWPPMDLQERVSPPPTAVGSISRYVYNMMGVKIKGEHEVIEMAENKRLVVKTISGLDSTFIFTFAPQSSGMLLTIEVDYELPGSILGKLLNKLVVEEKNEKDLEAGLKNLKAMAEA